MISKIAKYRIDSELGRGGFGRVYQAFDPDVHRAVAIKVLTAESDPEILQRFQAEIGVTGRLRHKNIVTLFECGEQSGVPFLVMELLEGQTLERVIKEGFPLGLLDKVRIMAEVAEGLSYAHSQGVIHRDVKPGNIMLLPDGSVKIMDFGIARVADRRTNVTRDGYIVGTIPYMAPEQFDAGGKADEQTDIFAYGDVYYELLTGRHPFSVDDIYGTIGRIKAVEPDSVSRLLPECPDALELLVHRALAKEREIRYQSFKEVLLDGEAILSDLQHDSAVQILAEVRPLIDAGKIDEAESKLHQVLALEPGNHDARQLRSRIRNEIRQRDVDKRVADLLAESEAKLRSRQFAEAVQTLETALRLNKSHSTVQQRLAEANAKLSAHQQANKLLAEARRDQQRGHIESAIQRLNAALDADPHHPDANSMITRLNAELVRAREQAMDAALGAASNFLAQGDYEKARAALQGLESNRAVEFRERIDREQRETERRKRAEQIDSALASIRQALRSGELVKANHLLRYVTAQFGDDRGVSAIIEQLQQELDRAVRAEAIAACAERAREFARQKDLGQALTVLREGLERFPDDPGLLRMRDVAEARHAEEQRELERQRYAERLQQLLRDTDRLEREQKYEEAIRGLEAATEFTEEPAVRGLLDRLRSAAALREEQRIVEAALQSSREMEQRHGLERALAPIESALSRYPQNPSLLQRADALRKSLAEEQRRARLAAARKSIEDAIALKDWKSAEESIARARREFPGEQAIDAYAEKVRRGLFERGLNETAARVIGSLKANKTDAAAEELNQTAAIYADDPRWKELQEQVRRRAAYEKALSEAEKERRAGEFGKAEALLTREVADGTPDDRATRLLDAVRDQRRNEEARERAEKERLAREQSEALEQRQREEQQREARRLEQERLERERAEKERLAREQAETLEQKQREEQQREARRLERVRLEHERLEKERLAREQAAALEQKQREEQQREARRLEQERLDRERLEKERLAREQAEAIEKKRREEQAREARRVEQERLERERLEKERLAREQAEKEERKRAEQARREKAEQERLARQAAEAEIARRAEKLPQPPITAEEAPKKPFPTTAIAIGAAALALIVAALIFGPRLFHNPTPVKPPETTVAYEIRTDPPGAAVKFGDRSCVTPNCNLQLAPGEYSMDVRLPGYLPLTRTVTIHAGDRPLDLTLQPVPVELPKPGTATGTLVIRTGVPDAQISVDKTPRGRSDSNGDFTLPLEAKSHQVTVEKTGYITVPREQTVRIGEGASLTITFKLEPEDATLEVRGAPAGAQLSVDGKSLGNTNGSVFTASVKPGEKLLQVAVGGVKRETRLTFDPGRRLALDWPAIAPAPPVLPKPPTPTKTTPQPTEADLEAKAWDGVRASTNPADLEKFLKDFPRGAHAPQAAAKLDDLAYSAVNKKDPKALQAFIDQHSASAHRADAQNLLTQIENDRIAEQQRLQQERVKQEQAQQQSQQLAAQAKAIQAAIDRFNAAFQSKRVRNVRDVWPGIPSQYANAMDVSGSTFVMTLRPTGTPNINGDTASIGCELITTTTLRGRTMQSPPKGVNVTLQKHGDEWIIVDPLH